MVWLLEVAQQAEAVDASRPADARRRWAPKGLGQAVVATASQHRDASAALGLLHKLKHGVAVVILRIIRSINQTTKR